MRSTACASVRTYVRTTISPQHVGIYASGGQGRLGMVGTKGRALGYSSTRADLQHLYRDRRPPDRPGVPVRRRSRIFPTHDGCTEPGVYRACRDKNEQHHNMPNIFILAFRFPAGRACLIPGAASRLRDHQLCRRSTWRSQQRRRVRRVRARRLTREISTVLLLLAACLYGCGGFFFFLFFLVKKRFVS